MEPGVVFEDDYLTNILDLNSDDLWRAAADCCRALAAKYAKEATDLTLGKGDIKIDRKKKASYYLSLAKTYDNRSGSDTYRFAYFADSGWIPIIKGKGSYKT